MNREEIQFKNPICSHEIKIKKLDLANPLHLRIYCTKCGEEVDYFHTSAVALSDHEIDQILGKALNFPKYDEKNFPGAQGQVCTGDHVPASLASQAAQAINVAKTFLESIKDTYKLAHFYGECSIAKTADCAVFAIMDGDFEEAREYQTTLLTKPCTCGYISLVKTLAWLNAGQYIVISEEDIEKEIRAQAILRVEEAKKEPQNG